MDPYTATRSTGYYLRNLPTLTGRHLDHHRPLVTVERSRRGRHVLDESSVSAVLIPAEEENRSC
jgi:hypothetical protein